jgi:hypothetical protein
MEPMRIAIVPYEPDLGRELGTDLYIVANAVQRQVAEHFAPAWGATAIVTAFPSPDTVPEGYSTVAITRRPLLLNRGGFHYPDGGAGALVHYDDRWTINVSHEVLEMVADPLGVRHVFGPSLADSPADGADDRAREDTDKQGLVEYLVEVCDPVEGNDYIIDGVRVCDFVFPDFYIASSVNARYSFTYAVDRPFKLGDGGYISWAVNRPDGGVFQATRKGNHVTWRKVAETSTRFSRQLMDVSRSDASHDSALRAVGADETKRGTIGRQLAARAPRQDPYVRIIDMLANDETFWQKCYDDPRVLLDELRTIAHDLGKHLPSDTFADVTKIAPQSEYKALSAMYHRGHPLGYDFAEREDALALAGMFSS